MAHKQNWNWFWKEATKKFLLLEDKDQFWYQLLNLKLKMIKILESYHPTQKHSIERILEQTRLPERLAVIQVNAENF